MLQCSRRKLVGRNRDRCATGGQRQPHESMAGSRDFVGAAGGGAGGFYIYKARKHTQQQVAAPHTQAPIQSAESNQTGTTATGPTQTELTKPTDTKVDKPKAIPVIARLRQSKPSKRRRSQ